MARKKNLLKPFLIKNSLLLTGLLFISIFLFWRYHQARILSFNTRQVAQNSKPDSIKPVYIKSYPLGIDVDIKESTIDDGVWAINPNSANFLIDSAGIGDGGNTIVYGHNRNDILGPLRWIKVGTKIEILGSDGQKYYYEVVKTDTVEPDNLEYIKISDSEILTIYTCTGFFDSKRFVALAKPIK